MSDDQEAVAAEDRWVESMDWLTRFQEAGERELSTDEIRAWQQWIADDENRHVFDRVSRFTRNHSRFQLPARPSAEDLRCDNYDPSIPLLYTGPKPQGPPGRRTGSHDDRQFSRSKAIAIAASVALLVIGGVAGWLSRTFLWRSPSPPQIHQTASGEIRHIDLQDGSTVILGAKSSISVQYTPERRAVSLDSGEAWFHVARSPQRPFVVSAGRRTITALGTAFVVERDSDRVVVTVTDGTVAVAQPALPDRPAFRLPDILNSTRPESARVARGERIAFDDAGSSSPVEHTDPAAVTSWSEGRLEFDHQPLRYVVETVNRYSRTMITVDQFTGDQIFSGLVFENQIDAWIRALPRSYPVELLEHGDQVCLHARDFARETKSSVCADAH